MWWGKFEREISCPPRNGPFPLNTHTHTPPPRRLETVKQRHNLTRSCPFRLLPLHFADKSWRAILDSRLAQTHTPTHRKRESEIENLRLSCRHCALCSSQWSMFFFQRHFATQGNATDFDNNEAGKWISTEINRIFALSLSPPVWTSSLFSLANFEELKDVVLLESTDPWLSRLPKFQLIFIRTEKKGDESWRCWVWNDWNFLH